VHAHAVCACSHKKSCNAHLVGRKLFATAEQASGAMFTTNYCSCAHQLACPASFHVAGGPGTASPLQQRYCYTSKQYDSHVSWKQAAAGGPPWQSWDHCTTELSGNNLLAAPAAAHLDVRVLVALAPEAYNSPVGT
jgi:hypothetical protein